MYPPYIPKLNEPTLDTSIPFGQALPLNIAVFQERNAKAGTFAHVLITICNFFSLASLSCC